MPEPGTCHPLHDARMSSRARSHAHTRSCWASFGSNPTHPIPQPHPRMCSRPSPRRRAGSPRTPCCGWRVGGRQAQALQVVWPKLALVSAFAFFFYLCLINHKANCRHARPALNVQASTTPGSGCCSKGASSRRGPAWRSRAWARGRCSPQCAECSSPTAGRWAALLPLAPGPLPAAAAGTALAAVHAAGLQLLQPPLLLCCSNLVGTAGISLHNRPQQRARAHHVAHCGFGTVSRGESEPAVATPNLALARVPPPLLSCPLRFGPLMRATKLTALTARRTSPRPGISSALRWTARHRPQAYRHRPRGAGCTIAAPAVAALHTQHARTSHRIRTVLAPPFTTEGP